MRLRKQRMLLYPVVRWLLWILAFCKLAIELSCQQVIRRVKISEWGQVPNICNGIHVSQRSTLQAKKAKCSALLTLFLGRLSCSIFQQLPASIGTSGTLVPGLSESQSLDAVQSSIAKRNSSLHLRLRF